MCQSKAEGGKRCAYHIKQKLHTAKRRLKENPDDWQVVTRVKELEEQLRDTPSGQKEYKKVVLHQREALNGFLNQTVVPACGDTILRSPLNSYDLLRTQGRLGSTEFEKNIAIPALQQNETMLLEQLNKEQPRGISVERLVFPDETESGARSIGDFYIDLSVRVGTASRETVRMPVNIKYTSGNTQDNLLGNNAWVSTLSGDENITALSALSKERKLYNAEYGFSDYHFLTFTHGDDKPTEGYSAVSLLDIDPQSAGIFYNSAQSFPLQGKLGNVDRFPKDKDRAHRIEAWFKWLLEGNERTVRKAIEKNAQMRKELIA